MSAPLSLTLPDADATAALAVRIAPHLRPGHVILLEGPVGAGKSHFARALIQSLLAAEGRQEDVPSPTFTLVQVYETRAGEVWHADLYRLTDPAEAVELGLDEAFERAICLIEWPDRLGEFAPKGAMVLALSYADAGEGREARIIADGSPWAAVRQALAKGLGPDG